MTSLYITKEAYLKLRYYIEGIQEEISGFGKVRTFRKGGEVQIEVYDIEILEQTVTGAHASISEETYAKFVYDKTRKGESIKDYKLWWHSHCTFGAFFSGTDTGTIDASTEFPWLVSLVSNHKGEYQARYDAYEPKRITVDNLRLEVVGWHNPKLRTKCEAEIKAKVKVQRYTAPSFKWPKGWNKKKSKKWKKKHGWPQQREITGGDDYDDDETIGYRKPSNGRPGVYYCLETKVWRHIDTDEEVVMGQSRVYDDDEPEKGKKGFLW